MQFYRGLCVITETVVNRIKKICVSHFLVRRPIFVLYAFPLDSISRCHKAEL